MKRNKQSLVSIIVPTYNLKGVFAECLRSIVHQSYTNTEVIVVDNASTDGTSEMVKKQFPSVKLIINTKNLGSTGGMNTGLREARGDYLWFIDHDNILNKDMLSHMVKLGNSDEKIGIVVPKIYYWEKKDTIWAAGTSVDMITGINISREGKDVGQYDKVEEVDIAPANFLVKRRVIDKVGFYDDVFFVCYEDSDFCHRVKKANYKIIYTPKAFCYHKFPILDEIAKKQRWLSRSYYTARNKIIFMKKDSPYFALFVLLYPAWIFLYTYQAIRYWNFGALRNFYKGIYDGFKWSFIDYYYIKSK